MTEQEQKIAANIAYLKEIAEGFYATGNATLGRRMLTSVTTIERAVAGVVKQVKAA